MSGLRIALRVEGAEWVAYVAAIGSMENALRFASIRMSAITSDEARQAWVAAMTQIGSDLISDMTGMEVLKVEVRQGPESERSGRA